MLPEKLKALLLAFDDSLSDSLMQVRVTIEEIAQELPQKIRTIDDLDKFSYLYVWTKYNLERVRFERKSKEILDFINEYFRVEKLLE